MDTTLRIAGIVEDSITDGPGIRTTVFVQGCKHLCKGCHNPTSWDLNGGKDMKIAEIEKIILDNPLLDGVTISGGEPFLQAKNLLPLAKSIKNHGLELAIYTGYTYEELLALNDANINNVLAFTDILVDGRFDIKLKNLCNKFKGSDNQRIIDINKTLSEGQIILDTSTRWN